VECWLKKTISNLNNQINSVIKSQLFNLFVIPAKAGIQELVSI